MKTKPIIKTIFHRATVLPGARRVAAVLAVMMMTVVQTAWADNPTWLKSEDTWDATTKTLTVNSNSSNHVYENNTEIKHLVVSSDVIWLSDYAFSGCTSLETVSYEPNSEDNKFIDEGVFKGCSSLTSIILPEKLHSIGKEAFKGCIGLTSITLPTGLGIIGISAFEGCTGLTSITLPYTIFYAPEKDAFKDCTNLVTVIDMCQLVNSEEYKYSISGTFGNVNSSCHFYVRNRYRVSDYNTYSSIITVVSGVYTSCGAIATTTVEPFFTFNGMNYYPQGTEFTISNSGPPAGYCGECQGYSVDGATLNGTTLTLSTNDVSVNALFELEVYNLTFDLDGGYWKNNVNPNMTYTVENFTMDTSLDVFPTPSKDNYIFIGWTGPGYTEPTKDGIIPKGATGDRKYTAHWQPEPYTITYDLDGGTLPSGVTNPITYNYETETFTLNNPTREGYYFFGWTGSNGNTAQKTVAIANGSYGPKSYTARWAYLLTDITDANVSEIAGKLVALQRTFTKGKPMTICLPFVPDALLDEGSMWEFTGISADHKAVMSQLTSGLQANKPYIFIPASSFEGTIWRIAVSTIDLDPKTVDTDAGFTFHGTYTNKHWDADDPLVTGGKIYGFMAEDNDGQTLGQFVKARRATNLRAFSCYLEYDGNLTDTNPSSQARTRGDDELPDVIDIVWRSAGDETGIDSMENGRWIMDHKAGAGWYSLDGRRLSGRPSAKGIYIHEGKKIVIK